MCRRPPRRNLAPARRVAASPRRRIAVPVPCLPACCRVRCLPSPSPCDDPQMTQGPSGSSSARGPWLRSPLVLAPSTPGSADARCRGLNARTPASCTACCLWRATGHPSNGPFESCAYPVAGARISMRISNGGSNGQTATTKLSLPVSEEARVDPVPRRSAWRGGYGATTSRPRIGESCIRPPSPQSGGAGVQFENVSLSRWAPHDGPRVVSGDSTTHTDR